MTLWNWNLIYLKKVKHGSCYLGTQDYFLLFAEIPERSISQIVQSMHRIGLDLLSGDSPDG